MHHLTFILMLIVYSPLYFLLNLWTPWCIFVTSDQIKRSCLSVIPLIRLALQWLPQLEASSLFSSLDNSSISHLPPFQVCLLHHTRFLTERRFFQLEQSFLQEQCYQWNQQAFIPPSSC